MINVSINNTIEPLKAGSTVLNVLQKLGYGDTVMLGIAINKTFVPKEQWGNTELKDSDELDILKPISGG